MPSLVHCDDMYSMRLADHLLLNGAATVSATTVEPT